MSQPAVVMVDGDSEYPVFHETPAWSASLEWARFHGLDPMRIPAGSYIERDATNRRIVFTEFLANGPDLADIVIVDGDAVQVDRVEQGEAPPLPFPPEVTG